MTTIKHTLFSVIKADWTFHGNCYHLCGSSGWSWCRKSSSFSRCFGSRCLGNQIFNQFCVIEVVVLLSLLLLSEDRVFEPNFQSFIYLFVKWIKKKFLWFFQCVIFTKYTNPINRCPYNAHPLIHSSAHPSAHPSVHHIILSVPMSIPLSGILWDIVPRARYFRMAISLTL